MRFDGYKDGQLLDAKGRYSQFIDRRTGLFYDWFADSEASKLRTHYIAAQGQPIVLYGSQQETVVAWQDIIRKAGAEGGVTVVYRPSAINWLPIEDPVEPIEPIE